MLHEPSVVLPLIEAMHAREEPAFKGQWRRVDQRNQRDSRQCVGFMRWKGAGEIEATDYIGDNAPETHPPYETKSLGKVKTLSSIS